jgi:hypothetical protein
MRQRRLPEGQRKDRPVAGLDPPPVDDGRALDHSGVLLRATLGEGSSRVQLERKHVARRHDDGGHAVVRVPVGQAVDPRICAPPVEAREAKRGRETSWKLSQSLICDTATSTTGIPDVTDACFYRLQAGAARRMPRHHSSCLYPAAQLPTVWLIRALLGVG